MQTLLVVILSIVGLVVALIVWRYVATVRAGSRRTQELAERVVPVIQLLRDNQSVDPDRLRQLALDPATRRMLHAGLLELNRVDLFPSEFATPEALAASDMVYWLRHPNELGASPEELELTARLTRSPAPDAEWTYFVFRYRTGPPHWAAADGWMAGVAGPYGPGGEEVPGGPAGTFSTFEAYDAKPPDSHVDFSHAMAVRHCRVATPPAEGPR